MLLTCPKCRSGLEVPDGTTALVRCPACKTVFSPSESPGPEPAEKEEEAEEQEEEKPKAKVRTSARDEEEEEEEEEKEKKKPKAKARKRARDEEEEDEELEEQNRDFDPITEEEDRKRRRKKRRRDDSELDPEEKAERKRAFERAAIGVKLIWVSFALFMFSMVLINIYFFQSAFTEPMPLLITFAGVLGVINWLLAAVGVGLCLSGPRAPGHWTYGISAACAVFVHFVFLLALVGQGKEIGIGRGGEEMGNARWGLLPTRQNATMFYMVALLYPDQQGVTKGRMALSMITGIVEMTRTVLIMMLLSCLARAALDNDLAHKCTRAAGIVSGGPGLLSLIILIFFAVIIETNAGLNLFTLILLITVQMSVYAILIGVILPSFMAARDVADACDEPFQSLIPQL